MSNKFISSVFACVVLSVSVNSVAEEKYVAGNVSFIDATAFGYDVSATALVGAVGVKFNENIAGEIRAGFGITEDTIKVYGYDFDVGLESMFGAYILAGLPLNDSFNPYIIAGCTRGEVSASGLGDKYTEAESDFSFGVGSDFSFGDEVNLRLEYINYFDKDGGQYDAFSVGLVKIL